MVHQLLILGGAIFVLMGVVHGLAALADVYRPSQFTPDDDAVRVAMQATTVRFLRARATVWDAWLGFNLSHSLGMFVFGCAAVYIGASAEPLSSAALAIPAAIGLIYCVLSVRFWFYAPAAASIAATTCFVLGWWIR